MRVKSYIRRTVHVDNGVDPQLNEVYEEECDFNEMHAKAANTVLEFDGTISLKSAQRLIDYWNRIGNYGDVIYSYTLVI